MRPLENFLLKHIVILLLLLLAVIGFYIYQFNLSIDSTTWEEFGAFAGGSIAVLISLYGVCQHRIGNVKTYTIEDHIQLMNTYRSAHSGGYTNKGYEFINLIWESLVSQLVRNGEPTINDIKENSNLSEMAQWKRSLQKMDKKLVSDFVLEMTKAEVKLAWLYLLVKEIPLHYKAPLKVKFEKLSLTEKEYSIFNGLE
jgi:hypothetical protein